MWPGLLIVRIEGRAFFLNAQRIGDRLWPLIDESKPAAVLLDCGGLIDIEYTGLKMLIDAEQRLQRQGVAMWMAALNPAVLKMVQPSSLSRTLGRERMFFNVPSAVQKYEGIAATEAAGITGYPATPAPG